MEATTGQGIQEIDLDEEHSEEMAACLEAFRLSETAGDFDVIAGYSCFIPEWGELLEPDTIKDVLEKVQPVLTVLESQTRGTVAFSRMRKLQRKVKAIEVSNGTRKYTKEDLSNLQKDLQKCVADIHSRIPIQGWPADVILEDAKVIPFSEPPRSLGGLPQSGIDQVALKTSSFYCSLERPISLPEVKDVNINEVDVKKAYLTMCNGNFSVHWEVEHDLFRLRATLDDDDVEDYVIELGMKYDCDSLIATINSTSCSRFYTVLSEQKANRLRIRILHCFLRTEGACLPWIVVRKSFHFLFGQYKKHKFRELLDICMCLTDIAIKQDLGSVTKWRALFQVSLALEALGRMLDAAHVYKEALDEYSTDDTETMIHICHNCVRVYMLANRYEEAYVVLFEVLNSVRVLESGCSWDDGDLEGDFHTGTLIEDLY